jgi:glycerol-3-phosphate dehydrogenase
MPGRALEPRALPEEVCFLRSTHGRYLHKTPTRRDGKSVFTGIRPLVRRGETRITAAVSRDHTIEIHPSGLVTTTGGKWTTYRRMAEEAVTRAAAAGGLASRPSPTALLPIHGAPTATAASRFGAYGTDADGLERLCSDDPDLAERIDPELPTVGAEVVWAARHEMARTVEDVLARRSRALFLNAAAARRMSAAVAALLARELGRSDAWQQTQIQAFHELAQRYMVPSIP